MNITIEEKAKIVAMARLLGANGSDVEILQRYSKAYDDAYATFLAELPRANPVTVLKRPF